jgi:hypothetical protein
VPNCHITLLLQRLHFLAKIIADRNFELCIADHDTGLVDLSDFHVPLDELWVLEDDLNVIENDLEMAAGVWL